MTIRNMVMVAGLAAVASGCVVAPGHYEERRVESNHRVVYHEDDSYEGYYYARVVYISGDPWYVDDYRRARPIPRHLHAHFRNSSWTRSLPPRFSQDTGVRDGYHLSRIVYINDAPHHIDDDRRARPVPTKLRSRFSYVTVVQDNDRGRKVDARQDSPVQVRGRERDERPAYVRERERQELPAHVRVREEPPAYGRGAERDEPPAYVRMRERERDEQPAYVRGRDRDEQPAYVRDREREEAPAYVRMRERDERPVQVREQVRHEQSNGREREAAQRRGNLPQQAVMQERVRDERGQPAAQGRGRSDDERIERGRAPGVEGRGRIQAVSDDRPNQRGAAKGNDPRSEEKRKGKGRDKDGDDDEGEEEADRKQRGRH